MIAIQQYKKGVTAVVATVLLLMMTVAAAGLAYVWITEMQKNIQIGTETQYNNQQIQAEAKLSIDSAWNTSGNISLVLRNTGSYTFNDPTKFSVYYEGRPVEKNNVGFSTGALGSGGTNTVYINRSFATPDSSKTIRIVTDVGTDVIYRCAVPSSSQNYC